MGAQPKCPKMKNRRSAFFPPSASEVDFGSRFGTKKGHPPRRPPLPPLPPLSYYDAELTPRISPPKLCGHSSGENPQFAGPTAQGRARPGLARGRKDLWDLTRCPRSLTRGIGPNVAVAVVVAVAAVFVILFVLFCLLFVFVCVMFLCF